MQCCAGALERVFLPFGWHGCSAARVHLNLCSYHLDAVLRGSSSSPRNGSLTSLAWCLFCSASLATEMSERTLWASVPRTGAILMKTMLGCEVENAGTCLGALFDQFA